MREILKLDANEGRPDPAPAAYAEFLDIEAARRYPDPRPLEAALAERCGVEASRVVVSSGGDDIIERYSRILVGPGGTVLGTDPAFESYADSAQRAGGSYVSVPRAPEAPFPAADLARAVREIKPAFVAFACPDNPGGGVLGVEDLLTVAAAGAPILFDATYSHFAGDQAVYQKALELPLCTVLGSFSKAYGLAGLRVGWAVTTSEMVLRIKKAGPPYPAASTSLAAALAALKGDRSLEKRVAKIREERDSLRSLLGALGARTWPSEANFVGAWVKDGVGLVEALAKKGILIRSWPTRPERKGLVRITCPGDDAEFARLADALKSVKEFL
jgi:histidinol-phosphate aminotransferase